MSWLSNNGLTLRNGDQAIQTPLQAARTLAGLIGTMIYGLERLRNLAGRERRIP